MRRCHSTDLTWGGCRDVHPDEALAAVRCCHSAPALLTGTEAANAVRGVAASECTGNATGGGTTKAEDVLMQLLKDDVDGGVADRVADELADWCRERDIPLVSKKTLMSMLEDWDMTELGRGGYGVCYRLRRDDVPSPEEHEDLVVKGYFGQPAHVMRVLKTEAWNLRKWQGEGVQRLVGVCAAKRCLLTYHEGENVRQLRRARWLSRDDRLSVLSQVSLAVQFGVKRGLCHNDIREDNICVKKFKFEHPTPTSSSPSSSSPSASDDGDNIVLEARLIDFGLGRRIGKTLYNYEPAEKNRRAWIAPELYRQEPCSKKTDVYSLGVLAKKLEPKEGFYPKYLRRCIRDATDKDPLDRPSLRKFTRLLERFRLERYRQTHGYRSVPKCADCGRGKLL